MKGGENMKKLCKEIVKLCDKLDKSITKVYPICMVIMLIIYFFVFGLVQAFSDNYYILIRFNIFIIIISLTTNVLEIVNVKWCTLSKTLIGFFIGLCILSIYILLTKNIIIDKNVLNVIKGITSTLCYMSIIPYGQIIKENKKK